MTIFTKQHMTGWIIGLLIILNILSVGTIWFLQFRRQPLPPKIGPEPVQHFLEAELQLTQEQAQQFERLRQEHSQAAKALNDAGHQLKGTLLNEVFTDSPDLEKVKHLAEEIGKKQTELDLLLFQHLLALKSLCSPEQADRLQTLIHEVVPPPGKPPQPDQSPDQRQPSGAAPLPGAEPPREAVDACRGQEQGTSCQFTTPHGTAVGICQRMGNQLACVPEDGAGNRPPMRPPSDKQTR
jgi:Spy/CpxP family protein refolding chaperone